MLSDTSKVAIFSAIDINVVHSENYECLRNFKCDHTHARSLFNDLLPFWILLFCTAPILIIFLIVVYCCKKDNSKKSMKDNKQKPINQNKV